MKNNYELPMIMSAKDLQSMGLSRSMAYRLLQGDLMPVVTIGKRRFIRHETLLEWLTAQEHKSSVEDVLPCESPPAAADSESEALVRGSQKNFDPDDDQLTFDGFTPELSDDNEASAVSAVDEGR